MRTNEQLTAVNNAEYQQEKVDNKNSTNKYVDNYKNKTLEILENQEIKFSEFIDEQSVATDISRLWWLKQWAMLKEQLSILWLYKKSDKSKEQVEAANNIFWAPNKTIQLWWLAV